MSIVSTSRHDMLARGGKSVLLSDFSLLLDPDHSAPLHKVHLKLNSHTANNLDYLWKD